MLKTLIALLNGKYRPQRHRDLLAAVWDLERWFDTPRQRASAELSLAVLSGAGLSGARLSAYACDGKTRYQDWIAHMAWDCTAARLTFADGGEVLADRTATPTAVTYWSAPLAASLNPAVGRVIDGDALKTITPETVDGTYLLTGRLPVELKRRLRGARPLAIVSDYLGKGRGYNDDTTKWINAWSDAPDGWYFHANDSAATGFNLSTARGRMLRERLAETPDLTLAGFCDARLYEGNGQNVTALIEGQDPSKEIWIYGHACETGAHDNCSGVTILIEALRLLNELIDARQLPRPRFSIRMIATEECLGMTAFATLNDDLKRRALVGMNVDGAGDPGTDEDPFFIHYGGLSNPTFGWAVAALIADELQKLAGDSWRMGAKPFVPTADDMIADPGCGIPGVWLGKGANCLGYHSSADTPDVCCESSLRYNTVLTACWAYLMATLDTTSAGALVGPAIQWIDRNILRAGDDDAARLSRWAAGRMLRDLSRWKVDRAVWEDAAASYCPPEAEPLDGLTASSGPTYRRTVWGACTFETLAHERRAGLSRWSTWLASGLYWCDGRRPLAAVERLARAETAAKPEASLKKGFDACVEAGTMTVDLNCICGTPPAPVP